MVVDVVLLPLLVPLRFQGGTELHHGSPLLPPLDSLDLCFAGVHLPTTSEPVVRVFAGGSRPAKQSTSDRERSARYAFLGQHSSW